MDENSVMIYCLKYAQSVLPESMVFLGGDKSKKIPIAFAVYLIKTQSKNILIDAGCTTMPNFVMEDFVSPALVLEKIGIKAKDVTDVIITHSHHDHIEAIKLFENANVYITQEEYESASEYIGQTAKINIIDDEYFIAPNIKAIKWGGHSKGSLIVEVKTDEATHIFAGDECYVNENLEKKIPTGSSFNLNKSKEFVEKFSDKKYCVHTCHDIKLKTERI